VSLKPYKYWSRLELFEHCKIQSELYGFNIEEIEEVVYDDRWNPSEDFNGCTLVQDPLHPFYPCLKHDYDWIVGVGGIDADRRFYNNLKKSGMITLKAKIWFIGVRLGWVLYYKWID
jgi:hypothetical protein